MKTLKMMLAFVAAMLAAVSCGSKKQDEEIVPVTLYDGDFQTTIARWQRGVLGHPSEVGLEMIRECCATAWVSCRSGL